MAGQKQSPARNALTHGFFLQQATCQPNAAPAKQSNRPVAGTSNLLNRLQELVNTSTQVFTRANERDLKKRTQP